MLQDEQDKEEVGKQETNQSKQRKKEDNIEWQDENGHNEEFSYQKKGIDSNMLND